MRKMIAAILIGGVFLLGGCEDQLPEDDLVNNGQAFEMQKVSDDLEASN